MGNRHQRRAQEAAARKRNKLLKRMMSPNTTIGIRHSIAHDLGLKRLLTPGANRIGDEASPTTADEAALVRVKAEEMARVMDMDPDRCEDMILRALDNPIPENPTDATQDHRD